MNPKAPSITIWAPQESPRLRYVLDWLFQERLGCTYRLTQNPSDLYKAEHGLSYGWLQESVPSIHAAGSLLWETGLHPQLPDTLEWKGMFVLYPDPQSPCDIQFDLLAGIFYLLSRYEEYLPFSPDRHGRYPATQSLLFTQLERPVVDEWVEALRLFLEQTWNVKLPRKSFSYQPSYDIDIAWSYRHKGWKRALGAAAKDFTRGQWKRVGERISVVQERQKDPFDSFAFLLGLHMMDSVRPIFFILVALQTTAFDKNISPLHPQMQALIRALGQSCEVGMHPSYFSNQSQENLAEEKAVLERILHRPILLSRQHFIRLRFPDTYRALIAAGIEADFSMGYSTYFGFRAGTSHSFLWYDLTDEYVTTLRVHPFAFMDSTAHYDLGLPAEDAFSRLRQMCARLEPCGGRLVTILHNYSLGTEPEWNGWRQAYERFVTEMQMKAHGTAGQVPVPSRPDEP